MTDDLAAFADHLAERPDCPAPGLRAENGRLRRVLEYALHLRMNGERARGGTETWRQFDAMCDEVLRAIPPTPTGEETP